MRQELFYSFVEKQDQRMTSFTEWLKTTIGQNSTMSKSSGKDEEKQNSYVTENN